MNEYIKKWRSVLRRAILANLILMKRKTAVTAVLKGELMKKSL